VFLLDEHVKMAGQATKWVIGGNPSRNGGTGLAPGATNSFNFVIQGTKPYTTTNLTAKLSFTRVAMEGGRVADPVRDVRIVP
jgi:hypothetical protein